MPAKIRFSILLFTCSAKKNAQNISLHVTFNDENFDFLHPATFIRGSAISLVSLMKSLKDAGHFS